MRNRLCIWLLTIWITVSAAAVTPREHFESGNAHLARGQPAEALENLIDLDCRIEAFITMAASTKLCRGRAKWSGRFGRGVDGSSMEGVSMSRKESVDLRQRLLL